MTNGEVKLLSDGTAWRPLLHVGDMSRAFVAAIETDRQSWHNLALNVGVEEDNYQIRNVARIVADVVPNATVTIAAGAGADSRNYNVSFKKIREALPKWRPTFALQRGTEHLYDGMLAAGFGPNDFSGHKFSRLGHLLHHQRTGALDEDLRWAKSNGV
jgi:nucleoside-diphosphate-sugar epimerase